MLPIFAAAPLWVGSGRLLYVLHTQPERSAALND
jgi:hypothetical protein